MPSPKGIFDCSIDVSKMMSKPTAFAPPSRVAVSTRPTSPVQVKKGEPSSGGVRPRAEHLPAQRGQHVERQAVGDVEQGRGGQGAAGDCNETDRNQVAR